MAATETGGEMRSVAASTPAPRLNFRLRRPAGQCALGVHLSGGNLVLPRLLLLLCCRTTPNPCPVR